MLVEFLFLQNELIFPREHLIQFCRYASLYFCMCIDQDDNELEVLEIIHHFVEILDRYFGSVRLNLFEANVSVMLLLRDSTKLTF